MNSYDFQTINGSLDIFEEETDNRSICLNILLKYKRIEFDNGSFNLDNKGGCIGDVLVNSKQQSGSLIWLDLLQQNTNNIIPFITNEINFRLNNLVKLKQIDNFKIENISLNGKKLFLDLRINNELLENIIIN